MSTWTTFCPDPHGESKHSLCTIRIRIQLNVIAEEELEPPAYRRYLRVCGCDRISSTTGRDVKHVPGLFASEVMCVFMRLFLPGRVLLNFAADPRRLSEPCQRLKAVIYHPWCCAKPVTETRRQKDKIMFKSCNSSSGTPECAAYRSSSSAEHWDSCRPGQKHTLPSCIQHHSHHSFTSPPVILAFLLTQRLVCTLVRLRAALSLPPGVRFLSWESSSSTSWAMARTVEGTSPGRRRPLVCSASSLATIAAVSPDRSWEREDGGRGSEWESEAKRKKEIWTHQASQDFPDIGAIRAIIRLTCRYHNIMSYFILSFMNHVCNYIILFII